MVAATKVDADHETPAESETPRPRSLAPVLKVIPEHCYERSTAKGLAYFARDTLLLTASLIGLAMTDTWWAVIGLWLVSGFVICGLFVLGHDAAHGSLFKSKKLNSIIGHLGMLPSLHVYEGWVYGHNRVHHGHTIRQYFDFVWHPITPDIWDRMPGWMKLRTKLEWSWLGAGLYYGREIWWNRICNWQPPPKWKANVRRDRILVAGFALAWIGTSAALGWTTYASVGGVAWMVFKLFVVPFYLFIHMIGWTVYVHHIAPDIKWVPRRDWNPFKGQMEGTVTFKMPWVLNFFWHNIFVHVPHHVDMRIPFYKLKQADEAIKAGFPDVHQEKTLAPMDYIRTTQACKLFDFDKRDWVPYPAGNEKAVTAPTAVN